MLEITGRRRVRAAAALTLLLSLGAMSCGDSVFGLDDDGAQTVRIALSVNGEGGSVTYAVSNDFNVTPLQDRVEIRMLVADTAAVALPAQASFPTGGERQFVFVVTDRSEVADPILLQVWLDDKLTLQQEFPLDGSDVKFLYLFGSGLVFQNLEVV